MIKNIILIATILLSISANAVIDKKNAILGSILLLSNKIDKNTANEYSKIINKYSNQYSIDPFLVVSILRKEGDLELSKVREIKTNDIFFDSNSNKYIKKIEITDFCMMQINKSNVISKKLNPGRLLVDADYCIHEGIKILANFRDAYQDDPFWWTRYNSSTPSKREIYRKEVMNFYNIIANLKESKSEENLIAMLSKINSID